MKEISGIRLLLLSMGIGLAAFLVSLDGFIVNVAIPTISGELGIREDAGTWIITFFTLSSTLFVPFSGWLAQRVGSVNLFSFATLFFSGASILCGLSHNYQILLFARFLQGAAAGTLIPLSLALIIQSFPEEKASVAIGFWSFFVMVGPAMGPMVGGWLSDYRWPWMFYINIPFALFSAITVFVILREKQDKMPHLLDWRGLLFLFLGVGSLQIALNRGNIDDWFRSPFITTLIVIAVVSITFFLVWEPFQSNPFIDFNYFKKWNFCLAVFNVAAGMTLLFSSFVLDSLWVQKTLGYTPAWAGLTLTPVGIFPLIFYPLMGKVVSKLDLRTWMVLSFLVYAATFFWLSHINLYTTFWDLALPRLVQGIGFAIFTVPNSLIAIHGAPKDRMIFVVSIFSFIRMMCVGFGVQLAVTLWTRRETFYQWRMTEKTYPGNPIFEGFLEPFKTLNLQDMQVKSLANEKILAQASTLALADIYYLYGWLFLALTLIVFLFRLEKHS